MTYRSAIQCSRCRSLMFFSNLTRDEALAKRIVVYSDWVTKDGLPPKLGPNREVICPACGRNPGAGSSKFLIAL